jgi:hypothetical protein
MLNLVLTVVSVVASIITILMFFGIGPTALRRGVGGLMVRPTVREKWMFGFALTSLVFCALAFWMLAHQPQQPPNYFLEWGNTASGTSVEGFVLVDPSGLQSFAKDYKLAAVEMHWNGLQDVLDTDDLQKSATFDIAQGAIQILIPVSPTFGTGNGDNFFLLLVPKAITTDQFQTLREAQNLGVKILQHQGERSGKSP